MAALRRPGNRGQVGNPRFRRQSHLAGFQYISQWLQVHAPHRGKDRHHKIAVGPHHDDFGDEVAWHIL
jgi:hypothetical protein